MDHDQTLNRRQLLVGAAGAAAVLALGARAPGALAARLLPRTRIGVQLFTVRDKVSSQGFASVFETLAGYGYREIEFAGYTQGSVGPITVTEIRALLDSYGLKAVGSHVGLSAFRSNIEQVLDNAETLGMHFIGTANAPSSTPTVSAYQAAAEEFNRFGEAAAARGMKWYQHNHDGEFQMALDNPTRRLYDVLLEETDPNYVFLQMDIFWAYVGQHKYGRPPFPAFEPLDYVLAQPNRYPLFHVKDGKRNSNSANGYDMVDVGDGDIDFQSFFCAVPDWRRKHFIMERDNANTHPEGSLASTRDSYVAMRALRTC